jgi:L-lactate dehydrogenase complex protein LldE
MTTARDNRPPPSVGLFVTCLIDLFRPNVGFAAVKLLEKAGCVVEVPRAQTCCGQPAYNNGDQQTTADIARQVIAAFETFDYVVAASGSCIGMIKEHYPRVLKDDSMWCDRAKQLAGRCYELTAFLVDVMQMREVESSFAATATYHDSCSGLRELGIKQQPRVLLSKLDGLTLKEMEDSEVCCGFGGTFCIKYPKISERMVSDKTANISATEADCIVGGDMGCLLNIAGRLKREGSRIKVYHVAEVLAAMTDLPAVGEGES